MRFLIDECLHESLVGIAHAAGFNRVDFVQLFGRMELHAGLIIIVPNMIPALQRALFEAVIQYLAGREPINSVIEVTLEGKVVKCVEYPLPFD